MNALIDFDKLLDEASPFALLSEWMTTAEATEPQNPTAAQLATVDDTGFPNVRTVLIRKYDPHGLVFFTNCNSTKGRELTETPKAALLFYWRSLSRQIRIRGDIQTVTEDDADHYFASRPRESQIGAHASKQSEPLSSRDVFDAALRHYHAVFANREVPRPPHWSGYRLVPTEIEFWQERPYRLHDRIRFELHDGAWQPYLLYP